MTRLVSRACINRNRSQGAIVLLATRAATLEAVTGVVFQDGGIANARLAMGALRVFDFDDVW
jgi:hypothetical protein